MITELVTLSLGDSSTQSGNGLSSFQVSGGLVVKSLDYLKDVESSWGEPERVPDCIWNAHTDMMQLFVQPDYYGYTGMG